VDVPNSASLNITGPVTLEAWVKTNVTNTQQGIIERWNYDGNNPNMNDGGYALRINANGTLGFFTVQNGHLSHFDEVDSQTQVTPGVWHHVAGVYDGQQLRVYLDGALAGSKASTFTPVSGTMSLKIGARGYDGTFRFNGLIDEVRVTSGAVYNADFTPSANLPAVSGTAGLWKFDSQTALDSSGNGNNGSLIGGPSFSSDVPH